MKKVMLFGTFDIVHPGHVNLFRQARKFGDYIIAVIARDLTVEKLKGKLPRNGEKARQRALKRLNLADKVVLGNLRDKYGAIKRYRPDVICLGYDQAAFTDELKNLGIKVIRLKSFQPNKFKTSKIK